METRHTSTSTGSRTSHGRQTSTEDTIRNEITDWLRDAYAMERGLEQALSKQAENEELSPELRKSAAMHLEETRRHAQDVRTLLTSLGTDTSSLKATVGILAQTAKGMGTIFARDERIKDLLDAYSMEHFEIACYTALAASAERAGMPQVVETCLRIIEDEERMAETLRLALPTEVISYLSEQRARAD